MIISRIAGAAYLLNVVTGALSAVLVGRYASVGETANLIAAASYVVVTVLFYEIFKPVNRNLSLLAASFSIVGIASGKLAFFGFYCLLIGYLIFRSTFLPRILGVLMVFAGLGWLTFLSPSLANHLSPYNVLPGLVGEGALTLWLLAFGLNVAKWEERSQSGRTGVVS